MNLQTPSADPPLLWLTILTRPRQTITHILATDPQHHVRLLSVLGGAAIGVMKVGEVLEPLTLICGVLGWVMLPLFTLVFQGVGVRLGGYGSRVGIRAAVAWSMVPVLYMAVAFWLWENQQDLGDLFWTIVLTLLSIWAIRTPLNCLSEVMHLSLRRTLVAMAVSATLSYLVAIMLAEFLMDLTEAVLPFAHDRVGDFLSNYLLQFGAA